MVNYIMGKYHIFFLMSSGFQHIPDHVCLINEKIFKYSVMDVVKCIADTNLQRHYGGNNDGNVALAGLGLPPSARTDDSGSSAELLFSRSFHELKGLLECNAYIKNPSSTEASVS